MAMVSPADDVTSCADSPERVDQVEVGQLVQVEDSRGEGGDQQVGRLVVGCSRQVSEVALLVEEVPTGATAAG